jgi:hypothetical protein
MDYFTVRNTVILALVQVGVITTGVLAAGATRKWYTSFRMSLPQTTIWLAEYGWLAMVLPLLWVTVALVILNDKGSSDERRLGAVFGGVALLIFLLAAVFFYAVLTWLVVVLPPGW